MSACWMDSSCIGCHANAHDTHLRRSGLESWYFTKSGMAPPVWTGVYIPHPHLMSPHRFPFCFLPDPGPFVAGFSSA